MLDVIEIWRPSLQLTAPKATATPIPKLLRTFSLQSTHQALITHATVDMATSSAMSPGEAVSRCYNYVVVGFGKSGLTIAARLTENPAINVLLLEAAQIDLRCF